MNLSASLGLTRLSTRECGTKIFNGLLMRKCRPYLAELKEPRCSKGVDGLSFDRNRAWQECELASGRLQANCIVA